MNSEYVPVLRRAWDQCGGMCMRRFRVSIWCVSWSANDGKMKSISISNNVMVFGTKLASLLQKPIRLLQPVTSPTFPSSSSMYSSFMLQDLQASFLVVVRRARRNIGLSTHSTSGVSPSTELLSNYSGGTPATHRPTPKHRRALAVTPASRPDPA